MSLSKKVIKFSKEVEDFTKVVEIAIKTDETKVFPTKMPER